MEKFGIFELLDALSAMTAREEPPAEKPRAEDEAFRPPVYEESQTPRQTASGDALSALLSRHEAIKKKAAGKR